ncbi:Spindle-body formation-associated protein [Ophiocordyceps camponoti-floridani]|uniref:Spindle-body formation-associated protein n=1 Tax=Ophiocordyceps camponoti-floridani TaxID=2030778 RepID=A0A8H4Q229_9HYPO|nr:Spindle-body formation-associated protein [Ophiocordyceps camponoti-floridani]
MLGWMLRGGENAPNDEAQGDATQVEQPDTPAPVFAARALKSALFGTPARPDDSPRRQDTKASRRTMAKEDKPSSSTPSKPPGILLTPGTGTSRRKRVSFGAEAASTDNGAETRSKATTKARAVDQVVTDDYESDGERMEALAKARTEASATGPKVIDDCSSDADWEEENDDDDGGLCTHDVTLDLNEPHSQSGRYWKGQFERYHQEAKAEMEKLLKYKQLAKSYARQKDAEALRLAGRLRDERQRVIKMEKKIANNASQIVSKHDDDDGEPTELLAKLTKQTALAAEYRQRVHELETELDGLARQKDQGGEVGGRRRRVMTAASPTTQKTLVETQRELRRARTQLKELDGLRHEVSLLKARVKTAESQASTSSNKGDATEAKARRLRSHLEESREETKRKTDELRQLKKEFEAFRRESEAHEADTRAVLERAHDKISELKREMRWLRTEANGDRRRATDGCVSGDDDDDVDDNNNNNNNDDAHQPRQDGRKKRDKDDALTERTNGLAPRWQPFVARSRGSTDSNPETVPVPPRKNDDDGVKKSRARSALPPERRAAALARIESRMEDKRRRAHDKENRRPATHLSLEL